jgi:hypothetical protein
MGCHFLRECHSSELQLPRVVACGLSRRSFASSQSSGILDKGGGTISPKPKLFSSLAARRTPRWLPLSCATASAFNNTVSAVNPIPRNILRLIRPQATNPPPRTPHDPPLPPQLHPCASASVWCRRSSPSIRGTSVIDPPPTALFGKWLLGYPELFQGPRIFFGNALSGDASSLTRRTVPRLPPLRLHPRSGWIGRPLLSKREIKISCRFCSNSG